MKKIVLILLGLFLCFTGISYANYPQPTGFVNDFAHVLSSSDSKKLEKKLSDFQKQTTNEISIVTVTSLNGVSIEEYSIGLASQWKPGVKGKDNGILIIFSIQDRKDRIEVGRGLEGNLTDIQSNDILDSIKPQLRAGDYYGAFDNATTQIMDTISGTHSATVTASPSNAKDSGFSLITFLAIIIVIFIIIAVLVNFLSDGNDGDGGAGGFVTGALLGGMMGGGSDDDDDSSSSSDDDGSSSSSSSDDDGGSFGGFSGGSFSGGGSSGGW